MKRVLQQSKSFKRNLRKWAKSHPEGKESLKKTLVALAEDDQAPSLDVHKLKGELDGFWACSAGYDLRIVFEYVKIDDGSEAIRLIALGTHDQVY